MSITDKLNKRSAECNRVTAHDIPGHYLAVVAKQTIADGKLMAEAVDAINTLQHRLHFMRNTMAIFVLVCLAILLFHISR